MAVAINTGYAQKTRPEPGFFSKREA